MRLCEWVIELPLDMFIGNYLADDTIGDVLNYAIYHVKEDIAADYCMPAQWSAWIVGEMNSVNVSVCVHRLSQGGPFPDNYKQLLDHKDI